MVYMSGPKINSATFQFACMVPILSQIYSQNQQLFCYLLTELREYYIFRGWMNR